MAAIIVSINDYFMEEVKNFECCVAPGTSIITNNSNNNNNNIYFLNNYLSFPLAD